MKAFEVILRKRGVVQRMVGGEPARRPVKEWVVVEGSSQVLKGMKGRKPFEDLHDCGECVEAE